ncbi:RecJ-like exonuclease with DnaJ-type Zn-finger domain [Candidatus Methanoperedens nitroreducens]|uniref:RecJ-like exonuclease with DnaJ-type Zn-finger domain n=1 Tax=Candidatus Methanoperedens nitratireducens TaxID=1392998 RepID=A0A062UYG1_9EURY|nr:DHH family phosphoesterase [Candidatus Methanoperedens nitroreducens]KCZ71951.1 RecJ-like exonuclease with DnaJ-type Zn-finger domain [Candidatus Methanoperedens nitroreducens]MDJ1422072.1 DHH family phosphoesterase [Candidatus Methanoperedens sp.]
MTIECKDCKGTGSIIISEKECPDCKGGGMQKSISLDKLSEKDLSKLMSGGMKCTKCNGEGKISVTEPCKACAGAGKFFTCTVCGRTVAGEELCESCARKSLIHVLSPECDTRELEIGKIYEGRVQGHANFGVFVNLNPQLRGLIHSSNINFTPEVGDKILIEVRNIASNGNIELIPKNLKEYQVIEVEKQLPRRKTTELTKYLGKPVHISGEVIQIKQTGGPTIFTISDEDSTVQCAAFEKAGERAYPDIKSESIVKVIGEPSMRNGAMQVEIRSMKQLWGGDATGIKERIDSAIDRRAEPHDTQFLVKSEVMEKLKPGMRNAARLIRKAVLKSRPIIIRHHADADGITSAIAIERALLPLIRDVGGSDASYHFYRRSPSKAPFYELEDVTKDLTFALEDHERFGQKMPLVVLMDNGATEEDMPSMKQAIIYGMDIMVIDHHHPDGTIDSLVLEHVNPAYAGGDYGITTGMLGTEIARMINPDVTEEIKHLPAVSAVGDRSEAPEAESYKSLVAEKYKPEDLKCMALALDYEAFWQRFNDGRGIMNDILNLGSSIRHQQIVRLLYEQANLAIAEQLEASMPNVKTQKLPNGAVLNVIDVENFAHKFTFPPPGKTSGEIHDRMCLKYSGQPVVTIGYGPDFAVLRSRGVKMNIPQIVRELRSEIKGAGVNGGGHLVVGSIKFVEGMRKEVLARLAEKIGMAGTG